jgi:hypothetical protein
VPGLREHCTNTMIVLSNGWKTLRTGQQRCIEERHIRLVYKTANDISKPSWRRAVMCMMMCIIWRYEDGGLSFQIQLRPTEPPAGAPFAK